MNDKPPSVASATAILSSDTAAMMEAANDIIWDHKLNSLPIVDAEDHLVALVFRKDYDSHKSNRASCRGRGLRRR